MCEVHLPARARPPEQRSSARCNSGASPADARGMRRPARAGPPPAPSLRPAPPPRGGTGEEAEGTRRALPRGAGAGAGRAPPTGRSGSCQRRAREGRGARSVRQHILRAPPLRASRSTPEGSRALPHPLGAPLRPPRRAVLGAGRPAAARPPQSQLDPRLGPRPSSCALRGALRRPPTPAPAAAPPAEPGGEWGGGGGRGGEGGGGGGGRGVILTLVPTLRVGRGVLFRPATVFPQGAGGQRQ